MKTSGPIGSLGKRILKPRLVDWSDAWRPSGIAFSSILLPNTAGAICARGSFHPSRSRSMVRRFTSRRSLAISSRSSVVDPSRSPRSMRS